MVESSFLVLPFTVFLSDGFRHRRLSEMRVVVCLYLEPEFVLWLDTGQELLLHGIFDVPCSLLHCFERLVRGFFGRFHGFPCCISGCFSRFLRGLFAGNGRFFGGFLGLLQCQLRGLRCLLRCLFGFLCRLLRTYLRFSHGPVGVLSHLCCGFGGIRAHADHQC